MWQWDQTLYEGSAPYYVIGRRPYPSGVATALRNLLGLDGTGRLLDVGCGPGALTSVLAPLFESAVGVDADPGMLAEAAARYPGVTWIQGRAEELSASLGTFRVVSFAQSFHWMDQPVVARLLRPMITQAWVHVGATTHQGVEGDDSLPLPRPPWSSIESLVRGYLGPERRAGQGVLGENKSGEEDVMRSAGYGGPERIDVGGGEVVVRTVDEIVASVFSLSGSAPHLFGERMGEFEAELRELLGRTAAGGQFCERMREISVVVWWP